MGNKQSHEEEEEEEPSAIELLPSVIKVKQHIQKVKYKLHKQKTRGLMLRFQQEEDLKEVQERLLYSQKRLRQMARKAHSYVGYWEYYKMVQRAYKYKQQLAAAANPKLRSSSTELSKQSNALYFSMFTLWEAYLLKRTHIAMMQQKQQKIHKKGWNKIVLIYHKETKLLSMEFDRESKSLQNRVTSAKVRNETLINAYLDHVRIQDKLINKLEVSPWRGESVGSIIFESCDGDDDGKRFVNDGVDEGGQDSDIPAYEDSDAIAASDRGEIKGVPKEEEQVDQVIDEPQHTSEQNGEVEKEEVSEVVQDKKPTDQKEEEERRKEEERRYWEKEEAQLLGQAEELKRKKAAKLKAVLEAEEAAKQKAREEAEQKEAAIRREEAEKLAKREAQKKAALEAEQAARVQAEEERNYVQEEETKLQTQGTEQLRSTRRTSFLFENQARDLARIGSSQKQMENNEEQQARIDAELEAFHLAEDEGEEDANVGGETAEMELLEQNVLEETEEAEEDRLANAEAPGDSTDTIEEVPPNQLEARETEEMEEECPLHVVSIRFNHKRVHVTDPTNHAYTAVFQGNNGRTYPRDREDGGGRGSTVDRRRSHCQLHDCVFQTERDTEETFSIRGRK
jgi:hypothetical protein